MFAQRYSVDFFDMKHQVVVSNNPGLVSVGAERDCDYSLERRMRPSRGSLAAVPSAISTSITTLIRGSARELFTIREKSSVQIMMMTCICTVISLGRSYFSLQVTEISHMATRRL